MLQIKMTLTEPSDITQWW